MKLFIYLFIELALTFQQCNPDAAKTKKEETALERENRLISEYDKQVVISKGMETFFIPQNEVNWFFYNENFHDTSEAKINDNICFFDTLGNIVYQALIINISNSTKVIRCQNLKNAEYYNTVLDKDSVFDLQKGYPYLIKAYRPDGRKCPTCK